MPISLPTLNNRILCKLYDKDDMKENELMGCFAFSIKDILAGKTKEPFWINVYGTLGTFNKEIAKTMNTFSELGSEWMGRI